MIPCESNPKLLREDLKALRVLLSIFSSYSFLDLQKIKNLSYTWNI